MKINFVNFLVFSFLLINKLKCQNLKTTSPVKFEINYETICPDSGRFIVNQLSKALKSFTSDQVVFDLVPYGKADVIFKILK